MAKANTNLAAVEGSDPEAPFGRKADGSPKKRRGSSGPRQNKPIHVLFQATDENGNPIPGAKLNVIYAGKDPNKVIEAMDANPGVSRTTVNL